MERRPESYTQQPGGALSAPAEIVELRIPQRPVRRRRAGRYVTFYATSLLGELAGISLEAGGAYTRLLCSYWDRRQPLPDDDRALAQLSGAGARWRRIRQELAHLFVIGEGVWRHLHLDHELEHFAYVSEMQARRVGVRWDRARAAAKDRTG